MNTYHVGLGGRCTYKIEASSISTAIARGIKAYLRGDDLEWPDCADMTEERKANARKSRRRSFNRLTDPKRRDEGEINAEIWVKRVG